MTTGVDIIGELLLANSELLSKVPATSIKAGKLPDGIALPALLVRCVTSMERRFLKRPAKVIFRDRVSVSVRAASYADQVEIIKAVRNICAGKTGNILTAEQFSILSAGAGPDLLGPGNSFEQTIDFMCSYSA